MKKLTTEKSGKREKSLVAHCSPSTANLRPTLTVEERFEKETRDKMQNSIDDTIKWATLFAKLQDSQDLKKLIQQELKANDDAWKEKIDKVIENNKNPDWDTYDYDGVALDLINYLKENK